MLSVDKDYYSKSPYPSDMRKYKPYRVQYNAKLVTPWKYKITEGKLSNSFTCIHSETSDRYRETCNKNYEVIPQEEAKEGADVCFQLLQYGLQLQLEVLWEVTGQATWNEQEKVIMLVMLRMKDEAPHNCFYQILKKNSFPCSGRRRDLKGDPRQRRFCSMVLLL
jgi:hypothetical protein